MPGPGVESTSRFVSSSRTSPIGAAGWRPALRQGLASLGLVTVVAGGALLACGSDEPSGGGRGGSPPGSAPPSATPATPRPPAPPSPRTAARVPLGDALARRLHARPRVPERRREPSERARLAEGRRSRAVRPRAHRAGCSSSPEERGAPCSTSPRASRMVSEGGALGMALHPAFGDGSGASPYVFVWYNANGGQQAAALALHVDRRDTHLRPLRPRACSSRRRRAGPSTTAAGSSSVPTGFSTSETATTSTRPTTSASIARCSPASSASTSTRAAAPSAIRRRGARREAIRPGTSSRTTIRSSACRTRSRSSSRSASGIRSASRSTEPRARYGPPTSAIPFARRSTSSSPAATTSGPTVRETSSAGRCLRASVRRDRRGTATRTRTWATSAPILGGFVYRGKELPELVGKYVFSDWPSCRVWALDVTSAVAGRTTLVDNEWRRVPLALAEDNGGELYLLHMGGIAKLVARRDARGGPCAALRDDALLRRGRRSSPSRRSCPTSSTRRSGRTARRSGGGSGCPKGSRSRSPTTEH